MDLITESVSAFLLFNLAESSEGNSVNPVKLCIGLSHLFLCVLALTRHSGVCIIGQKYDFLKTFLVLFMSEFAGFFLKT